MIIGRLRAEQYQVGDAVYYTFRSFDLGHSTAIAIHNVFLCHVISIGFSRRGQETVTIQSFDQKDSYGTRFVVYSSSSTIERLEKAK